MKHPLEQQTGLHLLQHAAIFFAAFVLLALRRPDSLFHAQFYAEDGHVWFADAYNLDWWHAFFRAQDGYFQTLPRIAASLAQLAPLALAPMIQNIVAIAVQALPVNLLLGSSAWGSLRYRALFAALYLAIPNGAEMTDILTSTQWMLALCAFLVIVSALPRGPAKRIFDVLILSLCCLTGPFCFFLTPVALFLAWKRRRPWHWVRAGVMVSLSLVQVYSLLVVDHTARARWGVLGADPVLFFRFLGGPIYLGALVGSNGLAASPAPWMLWFLLFVAIGCSILVVACFLRSPLEMKLFLVWTAMLLAASLATPSAYSTQHLTRWQILAGTSGIRYWFFPMLAFAWSLVWCLQSESKLLKRVSAVLLCLMCFGILRDLRYPAQPNRHYPELVQRFEAAPPGTVADFPENPLGWSMRLVKHR